MYIRAFLNNINLLQKRYLAIFILTFAGLFIMDAAVASDNKPVVDIQQWQTKNAVPVYFVATPQLPIVDMQVVFVAGAGRDNKNPGLAMFTNNMLNQGAGKLNADQIAQTFDKLGAQFSNNVDLDMGAVGLRSLTDPKLLQPALDTFLTILQKPTFSAAAFKLTKNRTLSSIELQKQAPNVIIKNALYATLYGAQAYGHPAIGNSASINALTTKDLVKFYQQYYVTKNAVIILVGDLTREKAEQLAEQISGILRVGTAATPLPPATLVNPGAVINIAFPSEQTHMMLGAIGITPQSPDFFSLLVGNYTLGGAMLTSRLFNEVREKRGLAYNVVSRFAPLAAKGPFAIYLQSRNNQAQEALALAEKTLTDYLATGPTDKELSAAKQNIIGSFPLQLDSNNDILNAVTNIAFYHLPLNYLDTYRDNVKAVTTQQIHAALNKYINLKQLVTIRVGPA